MGILSIDIQTAIITVQAITKSIKKSEDIEYIDSTTTDCEDVTNKYPKLPNPKANTVAWAEVPSVFTKGHPI